MRVFFRSFGTVPFVALICAAVPSAQATPKGSFLGETLPAGSYRAENFTMGIPKALAGVQARFTAAVAQQQTWLNGYLAKLNLKPGDQLPYDERLGVTRAEYDALTKAYNEPTIMPLQTRAVTVEVADGTLRFRAGPPLEFIGLFRIDPDGTLHGPGGLTCRPEAVTALRAKFGTWSGTSWRYESAASDAHRGFELSVGQLVATHRRFLYLDDSQDSGKGIKAQRVLTWLDRTGD